VRCTTSTLNPELQTAVNKIAAADNREGPARLFSVGHEFPSEYRRFLQGAAGEQKLELVLTKDRFPFLFQNMTIKANRVELLVELTEKFVSADASNTQFKLTHPGKKTDDLVLSATSKLGDLLRVTKDLPTYSPASTSTDDWIRCRSLVEQVRIGYAKSRRLSLRVFLMEVNLWMKDRGKETQ
jgi:hypothetical protein